MVPAKILTSSPAFAAEVLPSSFAPAGKALSFSSVPAGEVLTAVPSDAVPSDAFSSDAVLSDLDAGSVVPAAAGEQEENSMTESNREDMIGIIFLLITFLLLFI